MGRGEGGSSPIEVRPSSWADRRAVAALHGISDVPGFGAALASRMARSLVAERDGGVVGHLLLRVLPDLADGWRAEAVAVAAPDDDVRAALVDAAAVQTALLGCSDLVDDRGTRVPARGPSPSAPLEERFVHAAAVAAARVATVVGGMAEHGSWTRKADGSVAHEADAAADAVVEPLLAPLGVTVLSEERADPARTPRGDAPWICVDPIDGTGNFLAGVPPWAFSAGLVVGGAPRAGFVLDLSSGRRWWGAVGLGAWRDGRPIAPRAGRTVTMPSAAATRPAVVPEGYGRVRITGCTSIDLCLVADGAVAAWHDLDRAGTHVHDVAGALGVCAAAGATVLDPDGHPLVLPPDTERLIRFVVAATPDGAERIRRAHL